ncbi:MAG: pseudouridine synthase [Bacteroidales bacterium]|nr:pseudouridine synthase [Bacteroidales bacterium]
MQNDNKEQPPDKRVSNRPSDKQPGARPSKSKEPSQHKSFSGNDNRAEAPKRGSKNQTDKGKPKRYSSASDKPEQRDERPTQRTSRSDRSSGSSERPKRYSSASDKPIQRDERPTQRTSRSDRSSGSSERPKRYSSASDKPEQRDERPTQRTSRNGRSSGSSERPKRYSSASDKPGAKKPRPVNTDPDKPIRLNKFVANAGICSRREADKLIEAGAVRVNGVIVTELGTKVTPFDKVQFGDQTLSAEKLRYVLLNKPKDYITTVDDPFKRNTVIQLVRDACRERIYPVGRLDRNTPGLPLLTNDGELTRRLTHPRFGVRKIYNIELDKPLARSDFDSIASGVDLDGDTVAIDEIAYVEIDKNKKHIGIELHSGQNHVVRRIFEKFGYDVEKLDRVMFGPLTKKNLPRGRWRFLDDNEVRMLKRL